MGKLCLQMWLYCLLLVVCSSFLSLEAGTTVKMLPLPFSCSGIGQRWLKSVTNVRVPMWCNALCFVLGDDEVCQVKESGGGYWQCAQTFVAARHLLAFPRRYLQCGDGSSPSKIFYRVDRGVLWPGNLSLSQLPLLFHALDSVSGEMNLGTLGGGGYSAVWKNGVAHYNCSVPGGGAAAMLRMFPSESPWLQVWHNLTSTTLSLAGGFTVMVWSRKRLATTTNNPILDVTENGFGAFSYTWHIWNYPSASQYGWSFHGGVLASGADQTSWTHTSMRIAANKTLFADVNGMRVAQTTFASSVLDFGDRINIGRRNWPGDVLHGFVWDGCLGHVLLFNRTLSIDEVNLFSSLMNDTSF